MNSDPGTHWRDRVRDVVLGDALGREDVIDAHQLLTQAKQRSLLEDFGRGDFREGMDQLIAALNAADLTRADRRVVREIIVRRLMNRLEIRDWLKKTPTVVDEEIRAPIVVTGTDPVAVRFLGRVLGADRMNRAPLRWEAATTAPPAGLTMRGHDPRIATYPGDEATSAASCSALLASGFGDAFTQMDVPGYWDWWSSADHRAAYEHHRLQLQILQSAVPTMQWVLHSANHLWQLPALLHTYPDARVVWIHRDPAHVVERLSGRRANDARSSADRSRQMVADRLAARLQTALKTRARHAEASFFDLQYVELVDDAVGAVEWFYRHWGIALPDLSRWHMQALLGSDGVTPQPVKVTNEVRRQVAGKFDQYVADFEVPTEVSIL